MTQHLATITVTLDPRFQLDPLTLGVVNEATATALAQAYGAVAQVASQGQSYHHLSPALFDSILNMAMGAFNESALPFTDHFGAAAANVAQLQQQLAEAQGALANVQAQAQAAIDQAFQDGHSQGLAAGQQVAANTPQGGNSVSTGGFLLNIDTAVLAQQIAGHLAAGNKPVQAQGLVTMPLATGNPQVNVGVALGGVTLGKPSAAQGATAQPESASSAEKPAAHPAYDMDPSLIGDGSGSGGGVINTSKVGDRKVAEVRADENLVQVNLPTAKKQFSAGSVVFIVPSSDSSQWDDKVAVIADPKEGGDLAEIAEGAKAVLTKNLHYYAQK